MIVKDLVVQIEDGLHARPAAELVREMSKFNSSVSFVIGSKTLNAKSILGLMGLNIRKGQTLKVIIEGDDEEEVLSRLESFLTL